MCFSTVRSSIDCRCKSKSGGLALELCWAGMAQELCWAGIAQEQVTAEKVVLPGGAAAPHCGHRCCNSRTT